MLRVDRECFGPWPPVTMEVASSREVECRVADEAACARYPQDSQGGHFGLPAKRQRQETRARYPQDSQGGQLGALDCPRRGSGRRRAAAPMPEGLQTPRAKQNPGARRAPGFRKRTDLGPAHFFLAEDLEPPFDEPFEPDLEPPFAPPDFFAAVAMLVVLEASVILRREDDRTRLLNRNLIHKRRQELFRGFLGIAAKALVRTAARAVDAPSHHMSSATRASSDMRL